MTLPLNRLSSHGNGLVRPECVVAHESGWLFAPYCDGPGGISAISPTGNVHTHRVGQSGPDVPDILFPNGIALEDGGSFLIAHLGQETGGIYRLSTDATAYCITDTVEGGPMPPANFVAPDSKGRLWITISTTCIPRAQDYRPDAASGYIALHDAKGTRIVADGLGYTNECLLSADERTLWVNETFARRLTAFDVTEDGLANRRVVATFDTGTYPDGIAEAVDGSLFIASIVSNRILRVWPDGRIETLVEDVDSAHLDRVETAFQGGTMGRPHLDSVHSRRLSNISNIAFGGKDRKTAFLGCLLGDHVMSFDSPVAGRALPHWTHHIDPLIDSFGATT